jgi:hypothetical protein
MADFDHEQLFPLTGAHAAAECVACHAEQRFAGTPADCVACHPEPEIHAGQFGDECDRCHTTEAWTPAHLTRHTFPLDHGEEGKSECQTCHVESYAVYTCYSCHEHEPADIRRRHLDEGIEDFDNCVECHPTGREDEVEGLEGEREDGD